MDVRRGGERTGGGTLLSCDRESGDGACTPRSTVGECDTIARCGAGTFDTVVVVAIADLERFVVIWSGRIGDRGGDSGPEIIGIESSRLHTCQQTILSTLIRTCFARTSSHSALRCGSKVQPH